MAKLNKSANSTWQENTIRICDATEIKHHN